VEKIELEEARSGADLILDTLLELGISTIFGYPGGAVLPLYDAIYKNEEINHILSRHEQGSLHEAEGYAKSTGKLGVALVTSGPGATNAITGIADAMSDSVPLLVFTGQVATSGIGKDAFQEADIVGITMVRMPSKKLTLSELPCQLPNTTTRFVIRLIFLVLFEKRFISQRQDVLVRLL